MCKENVQKEVDDLLSSAIESFILQKSLQVVFATFIIVSINYWNPFCYFSKTQESYLPGSHLLAINLSLVFLFILDLMDSYHSFKRIPQTFQSNYTLQLFHLLVYY